MIILSEDRWVQVDGDIDPLTYGGTFARLDGWAIEIIEIQPVLEYVSNAEARDIGFPFWIMESYHDPADLRPENNGEALAFYGLDDTAAPLAIALARHGYGHREECAAGWSDTVASHLDGVFTEAKRADADAEFQAEVFV